MNWTATRPIRVVVLDDHAVVRHGLAARLKQETDIEVTGIFASGREVVQALRNNAVGVDVLLMDYSLGPAEIDGLNLIRLIRVRYPELKILVASAHHNKATVGMVMHAGARGFVGKEEELAELVRAIRTVATGGKRLNAALAAEMERDGLDDAAPAAPAARGARLSPLVDRPELSPREREVLRCCLDGMSVTDIADKFARSIKTISSQKQSAFRKLGIRSDTELFKIQHELDGP
ncbi:Transcriptional regulatory protein RcsB [Ralstonia condita]|uniref:Transcriptional regulatory protein RcsB n=1 Tax=Ralstonia condita TaxID=3058600 RepID=A0ABN9J8A5_9RALS|nr:response regulator transcription factor [Ralstonia sp. LMG 7141]MDE2201158.1 response regulator transcription factor [Burkholderiaceae bacterium]CAJ0800525.1 Transcriptional regulatory protein RcsB [Ralstonia sp. LMG 7141]